MTMRRLIPVALVSLAGCGNYFAAPPAYLPSTVRILYSKSAADSLGSSTDIYFVVARSGNELQLTGESGADRQPTFADDIHKVFFTREIDGRTEIWWMDLDGSQKEPYLAGPTESYRDPAVSPDRSALAYTVIHEGRSWVEVGAIDGSSGSVLIEEDGEWSQPTWSPDGGSLAVIGDGKLFTIDADGGEPRAIAAQDPGPHSEPAWGPGGDLIVFVSGNGPAAELTVVSVSTGEFTRITDNQVEDLAPSWSPTGERIIFVSRKPSNRYNLWLTNPDGENQRPLTQSEIFDSRDPEWM